MYVLQYGTGLLSNKNMKFDCCLFLHLTCITFVFVRLTSSLQFLHQFSTKSKRNCRSSSFFARRTISSAYNNMFRKVSGSRSRPTFEALISSARSFIKIANSVGDKQSPCLTPIGQSKKSVSN